MSSFEGLSAEVLALIFECLAPRDVLRARCVNRFWQIVAEDTVHRRNREFFGLSIELDGDEDVPIDASLPLFKLNWTASISHPGVAYSVAVLPRSLSMAPSARAKLVGLWPWNQQRSPQFSGNVAFPKTLFLHFYYTRELHGSSWPKVQFVSFDRVVPEGWALAMPICQTLTLTHFAEDNTLKLAECAHVTSLALLYGGLLARELSQSLQWLHLSSVTLYVEGQELSLVRNERSAVHLASNATLSMLKRSYNVVYLPKLEKLKWIDGVSDVTIVAPMLKELHIVGVDKRVYLDQANVVLEVLHLMCTQSPIDWLAFLPLKELRLFRGVRVENLNCLSGCANTLTALHLEHLQHDPSFIYVLPREMPKLRKLTLCNQYQRINISHDLGQYTTLIDLFLADVGNLTSLTWIANLTQLRTLGLVNLPALQSLDGLQHLPELHTLKFQSVPNPQHVSTAPIACIKSLRRLTLEDYSSEGEFVDWDHIDLRNSAITHLTLHKLKYMIAPTLPSGLRTLTISRCEQVWDLLALKPLENLRRLDVELKNRPVVLPDHCVKLNTLKIEATSITPGALSHTHVTHLILRLVQLNGPELKGINAPSLKLTVDFPREIVNLEFLHASTLRRLKLSIMNNKSGMSLAPLARCSLLEDLELLADYIKNLDDFAYHPSLREIRMTHGCDQFLDAKALLTCPKLLVVDIQRYRLPEGQEDLIQKYLETQKPDEKK